MADTKKEILQPGTERQRVVEEFPTVESPRKQENIEAMSWMEKIERRFGRTPTQAPSDVSDDTTAPAPQPKSQPPVTIGVTAKQMQQGQNLSPDFSLAWMVIWAKRQIQLLMRKNRKVLFSPENSENSETQKNQIAPPSPMASEGRGGEPEKK